jgi:imidazolonepropionase-like amidohydrolase
MTAKAMGLGTLALVVLVAVASGPEVAHAQSQRGTNFLVAHVRVFDGERVHEDTQVAVEGGIIRAVGRDLTMWRQLPVIDGTDATLIPGLIDAHAHVRSVDDLEDALRFGVTTVLDLAASGVTPQDLAELRTLAASRVDIADVLSAGFAGTTAGGHGTAFRSAHVGEIPTVASAKDADAFVAARRSEGSDYLKIVLNGVRTADQGMPNLDEPRVKALVDAAHSRGMLAVAHVETVEDAEIALASGVDGLAHVWRRGGANADLARRLVANGVFVIATLVIPDGLLEGRAALFTDSRVQAFLSSREKEQLSRSYEPRTVGATADERRASFDAHLAVARSLQQAGVTLLVGTDASMVTVDVEITAPSVHGLSVHRELELLLDAGLSPTEALTAATVRTAEAFRLTDRGRITAGRKADMVLVRGDPTSDITATRDILRVWRSGVEFDRGLGR